jgi:shikimate kinase
VTAPRSAQRVVLLGMMGAGKSTTGAALARRLGWRLCDSDQELEARTGASGAVLAARDGIPALHELEAQLLLEALEAPDPSVVTAAASVVDSLRCRAALRHTRLVVWLQVPTEVLVQRARSGSHRRPAAPTAVRAALEQREQFFGEVADLRLDATAATEHLVEAILAALTGGGTTAPGPPHRPG